MPLPSTSSIFILITCTILYPKNGRISCYDSSRLDLPDLVPLYREFGDVPVVSISSSPTNSLAMDQLARNGPSGLPLDLYECKRRQGDYLAFLGRISPEKRVDRAIEIAKRAKMKLKIAAKVDAADRCYYMDTRIRRLLDHPLVEFIGEIGDKEKPQFLGNAYALLFPIDWVEPFGLVMIEAMACGTPVVAFRQGSVPEVIDHGVTGFIVENIEDSLAALEKIQNFDRSHCRKIFEKRFSAARMAADYVKIYERLVTKGLAITKMPAVSAKASRARISVPSNGKAVPAKTLQATPDKS